MADLTRWRLHVDNGRQTWVYSETADQGPSFIERYMLGISSPEDTAPRPAPKSLGDTLTNAIEFYRELQCEDGHWSNDYGGPLFLMPGLIITCYITGHDLGEPTKLQMIRYLFNIQREDGGWGLHIESPSTMFGSALSYVSLRILGVESEHPNIVKARKFIIDNGGAGSIPSWGKFWLATLGVYDWEGMNPIQPEFWLLPYSLPLHPGRWWCHCRMVYLPMGYIYSGRHTGEITDLVRALRAELYDTEYSSIHWPDMRENVCALDLYTPHTTLVNTMHAVLLLYEKYHSSWLRERARREAMAQIHEEDKNTKYIDIGPVNKVINMLCVWFDEGRSERYQKHVQRITDYLWMGVDGMKMQGYNGSQLWDTAFSLQAIGAAKSCDTPARLSCLRDGWRFIESTQVREEVDNLARFYRHKSVGAWPFSTRDHGWPISDCTAEGLKAALLLREMFSEDLLTDERYYQAVDVILSLQNTGSGGWATYELQRGPSFLEKINPSETFHGIMVDYPYVECTSASIVALLKFKQAFPKHRTVEIEQAVSRGISFIKSIQRADGSWKGSWGVCFTYAIWFGLGALVGVGEADSPAVSKAVNFLLSKQREDGGWGESFESCVKMEWIEHPDGSQVVNTAWAVLSLLSVGKANEAGKRWGGKEQQVEEALRRGVELLRSKQLPNGDWAQEGISGVFNANCAISYSGYKNIFPIWAIAEYLNMFP